MRFASDFSSEVSEKPILPRWTAHHDGLHGKSQAGASFGSLTCVEQVRRRAREGREL